jgi:hypothetical protein
MGRPRKDATIAAKTQSGRLSRPPYAMPLDTIGNVRRELGRLYRASLSGKLESAEAARLAFILKEVRASLECERELHLDAPQFAPVNFTILSVPPGTQFDADNKTFVWPDGTPCAAPEFTPYEATPDWTALPPPSPDQSPVLDAESLEPIELPVDDGKVTRLHPYQRRHSSDDDPAGVA